MADSVAILCAAAFTGIVGEFSRRAVLGRRMVRSLRAVTATTRSATATS